MPIRSPRASCRCAFARHRQSGSLSRSSSSKPPPANSEKSSAAPTPVAAGLVRRLRNSARNRLRETMTTPGLLHSSAAQKRPPLRPAKSWSSRRLQSDRAAIGHVVTIPNQPGSWCLRAETVSSRTTTTNTIRTTASSSPPPLTKNRRSVSNASRSLSRRSDSACFASTTLRQRQRRRNWRRRSVTPASPMS